VLRDDLGRVEYFDNTVGWVSTLRSPSAAQVHLRAWFFIYLLAVCRPSC
jgi:hypothetical protein